MFDSKRRFLMEDYTKKTPFSSFLPGIAGKTGIPLWCFYVNRGQAVASFGASGKNDAILPFLPAGRAYRLTQSSGFRTFIRINETDYYEPFRGENQSRRMTIGMNSLHLLERSEHAALRVSVRYCVLPEEPVAALLRQVEIRNCGFATLELEVADGLPQIMPYGALATDSGYAEQKAQTRTLTRHIADCLPYMQMQQTSYKATQTGRSGHFAFAADENGRPIPVVLDGNLIFGYDTGLRKPRSFLRDGMEGVLARKQENANAYPGCFFMQKARLAPGECLRFNELYGCAANEDLAVSCQKRLSAPGMFDQKYARAVSLAKELCRPINTKTGDPVFDAYCKQCFLDNCLRGGAPERVGGKDNPTVFYIYRRMNGDLERDYNDFVMEPEYYSQGEVHFRDVIQNRQCDVRFYPDIGTYNLKSLVDLIQPDGYQPQIMESGSLSLGEEGRAFVLRHVDEKDHEKASEFLQKRFTPGRFTMEAENWALLDNMDAIKLLDIAAEHAKRKSSARYEEGYWTDFWCGILDVFLRFEEIYPDKAEAELFDRPVYLYFTQKAFVKPRNKRYVVTPEGVRQYGMPEAVPAFRNRRKWIRARYGDGDLIRVTLAEKFILLATLKFSTLDAWGFGIEMEAGREGWNNGLNGLPEVFGSASGDVCELLRLLTFLSEKLEDRKEEISVASELTGFFMIISSLAKKHSELFMAEDDILPFWREANEARESYRSQTVHGFSGSRAALSAEQLRGAFILWRTLLQARKRLAMKLCGGVHPAYMYYEMTAYEQTDMGILPIRFEPRYLPLFLEGAIYHFDYCEDEAERRVLHKMVTAGELYDEKLDMLRSCGSMDEAPRFLGDITAFNPGWYSNRSVGLQLEYKYLRKLLDYDLYDLFCDSFCRFAVPFMNAETYGRSPLENVSFIVSSVGETDEPLAGRGVEARYTGANAEFMYIWQRMMVGERPFTMAGDELRFALGPLIPAYLIPSRRFVETTLFGSIPLRYFISQGCDVIPGRYRVARYKIYYADEVLEIREPYLAGEEALRIRRREPNQINVYIEPLDE